MMTGILKKFTLYTLAAFLVTALAAGGWLAFTLRGLPEVGFLARPTAAMTLEVPDWDGNTSTFVLGPSSWSWTPFGQVPDHFRNAVLAGEDYSFYGHNGVDWFEVRESFLRNFRERRVARGASTITQQVAKNLFLTREKTVGRKVRELFLARRLEKALTKDRILELYMNLVELGDGVYGVGAGARHHFGKDPEKLTLAESAFLAAMLPGPKVYDPDRHLNRVLLRSQHILTVMLKGRKITEEQYAAALGETPLAGKKKV